LPFQMNSLLAMVKDDMLTVFLGKALSLTSLGLIGWGQKWAFMPLRFILDNVAKISFSALARIQDEKEKLGKAVNKAIFGSCFLTFPILLVINLAAQFLVVVIPRYQKWTLALPFLMYFSINAALACIFINLVNLLNAVGKVKITLILMIFWTTLSWILNITLIIIMGSTGVGIASVLMGGASMIVIYYAKSVVKIEMENFWQPLFSAFISFIFSYILLISIEKNFMTMLGLCFFAVAVYLLSSFLFFRKKMLEELSFLKKNL